jgi:hypothetical protein
VISVHTVQSANMVGSIAALMLALNLIVMTPRYRWFFVPFLVWIVYTILFYTLVFIRDSGYPLPLNFTFLSAIRGLLAVSLVLGVLAGFRLRYIVLNNVVAHE